MSAINATDVQFYVPTEDVENDNASTVWQPLGLAKSATLSLSADTPDCSSKESSGWQEVLAGQKSWTMDFDALVSYTGSNPNVNSIFTYWNNRSLVKVAFGQDGYFFEGNCIISSLEQSAEMEQPFTYSGSVQGSGALTDVTDGSTIITAASSYPNS